jgi:transcription elongation GreA/GreB family factor
MTKREISQVSYDELVARRDEYLNRVVPEAQARVDDLQNGGGDSEGLGAVEAVFDLELAASELYNIERALESSQVATTRSHEVVESGATVEVEFDGGERESYLVDEISGSGRISGTSPLGQVLMGHRAGWSGSVASPGGSYTVTIISVS